MNKNQMDEIEPENKCETVVNIIKNAASKVSNNKKLKRYLKDLECKDIEDDENKTFHFSESDSVKASENKIISALLSCPNKDEKLYRYIPLRTLYEILINKTIRMSGIAGMNDKTEQNFADKYIYGENSEKWSICNMNTSPNITKYITSCTDLKDNLNMWRLYADDAKGACLVFSQKSMNQEYFMLQNVMYSDSDRKNEGLDFLKSIVDDVKETGENFTFCSMSHWKHFFKPHDFSSEREVRLIFFDNKKYHRRRIKREWVLTYDNSIFNQVVDFPIDLFPLKLEGIVLGCKCPQVETNIKQIELLLKEKKLDLDVSRSKIECYR